MPKKKPKTQEERQEKEKSFADVKKDITPAPTPADDKLKHVGVQEPKKRHRRTRAEIDAAKQKPLTDTANPLFLPLIKMPFTVWARSIKSDKVLLTDDEAKSLALPVTQLCDYYLPQMAAIYFVWASLGMQVISIMECRFKIVRGLKGARGKGNANTGKKGVGQVFPNETPVQ